MEKFQNFTRHFSCFVCLLMTVTLLKNIDHTLTLVTTSENENISIIVKTTSVPRVKLFDYALADELICLIKSHPGYCQTDKLTQVCLTTIHFAQSVLQRLLSQNEVHSRSSVRRNLNLSEESHY